MMYSTQVNIVFEKPILSQGQVCRKHLRYPLQDSKRFAEGGLRCEEKYKQTLPGRPLITVITVVYNCEDTLEKTIESVLSQSYNNVEYIVIDGGSTDGTLEIIKKFEEAIDYYISEPDNGIYYAMNKGIELANGELIGLLNSGDWYEKDALTIIAEKANRAPGKIVAATQRILDDNFNIFMTRGLRFIDERVYLRIPLSHPVAFIPFNIYERVGNYDEDSYRIIADWDFFIRCYEEGVEFYAVSDVVVNYWRVGISAQGDNLILHEQVALLHSRFPTIKNYNILFLLSSMMDETSGKAIKKALQRHLNTGGKIPEKIMRGVYLYSDKTDELSYEEWLADFKGSQLQCIDDLYMFESNSTQIEELINKGIQNGINKKKFWLIGDRGWDAQDNGFALYVWVKKHHPEIDTYFVITKDSSDFAKVARIDPDTIVEYNSLQHKVYYLFSQFVISSHGGEHCHPLDFASLRAHYPHIFKSQYIFLQHGILKDYIDYFHKGRFPSALNVISGEMERRLFLNEYQYTKQDILEIGLTRFDNLKNNPQRTIFVMPTWRTGINNKKEFLNSDYYKTFSNLLKNDELARLLNRYNFELKFLIHPSFFKYADCFTSNAECIEILPPSTDIKHCIEKCAIAITDYSSVVMDVGYLRKRIIYYQFDSQLFRTTHYKAAAAFSYKRDGLGPVVSDEPSLLKVLEEMLLDDRAHVDPYQSRHNYLFSNSDKNSCQKVFEALDKFESLPKRLLKCYTEEFKVELDCFSVIVKGNILYIFYASEKKSGLYVQNFNITYYLVHGGTQTQRVDFIRTALVLEYENKFLHCFHTSMPCLTGTIEINRAKYPLPEPILHNYGMKKTAPAVAQLGHYATGGAGVAALLLHKGLRAIGTNNNFFTKVFAPSTSENVYWFDNHTTSMFSDWNNRKNRYKGNTIFTLTPGSSFHPRHDFLKQFDIINIHWISNYISSETIASLSHLGKPIVWTIHDMNPLTGGCHYFHGCQNWQAECEDCPQLIDDLEKLPGRILKAKKKYFNFKSITVVAISNHSKSIIKKSIFKDCRIEIIPNSLDIEVFKPTDTNEARLQLDVPIDKKVICYFPSGLSKVKGGNEATKVFDLLKRRAATGEYHLILGGHGSKQFFENGFTVTRLGHIDENEQLAMAYSAADVTIVPSLEETFSNTTAESLACGTPVVGFNVGGIPDMINDGVNGFTVELGDCEALADCLEKLLAGPNLSANCRTYAEDNLRLDVQASRYQELYDDLLKDPARPSGKAGEVPDVFPEIASAWAKLIPEVTKLQEQLKKNQLKQKDKIIKIQSEKFNKLKNNRWNRLGNSSTLTGLRRLGKVLRESIRLK